jgi:lipoprotein Spr
MHLKNLSYIIALILVFTSCKSVRNLTARDGSTPNSQRSTSKSGKKSVFIDDIEAKPGTVITAKNKPGTTTGNSSSKNNTSTTKLKPTVIEGEGFDIESANYLQIKYAVLTDAVVEKLTNVPLLQLIDKWWGTRYCMGGVTENCIDCSAFTQIIMRDIWGLSLPRTSQEQFQVVERIDTADLKEGDLVFFNTSGSRISHVGVYLLNNKFVHAATSGGVMISDLYERYWSQRFRGAGRVRKSE